MSGPNSLLKAVSAGRTRQIRLLLEMDSSTEETNTRGQTPLICAVLLEKDHTRDKILRILLKNGALVSRYDVTGRNPLMWASFYGKDTSVGLLIENADIDLDFNQADVNGQTALFHGVSSGNAATVKLLVTALAKYGMSMDVADKNGTTPLMLAQRRGFDICESILVYEGNAKVGLSNFGFEKFIKREKWATCSLRDRSKRTQHNMPTDSISKPYQFPPICYQKTASVNKLNLDIKIPLDSGGEHSSSDDEEESSKIERNRRDSVGKNKPQVRVCTPIASSHCKLPPCRIESSVFAPLTLSSVDRESLSSDEESEVDSVASTIIEGKLLRPPQRTTDLAALFGFKQEQMTSSYRKKAVKPDEPTIPEEEDVPPQKLKGKRTNGNWRTLKKGLQLSALGKNSRLGKAGNGTDAPPPTPASGRDMAPKRTTGLPKIANVFKLVNMQRTSSCLTDSSNTDPDSCRTYSDI